ncbi:hypothetical protein CVS40_5339 [Lucilia cuprina]|nr:hypothetical protein CVS40_5339 [Lucilia cuprina]
MSNAKLQPLQQIKKYSNKTYHTNNQRRIFCYWFIKSNLKNFQQNHPKFPYKYKYFGRVNIRKVFIKLAAVNMKYSLIFLLCGLCLVAVSANIEVASSSEEDFDLDYEYVANDIAEDVSTEIDPQFIPWLGIYFIIHKALTGIKGVKCTVKEVVSIKTAAQQFLDEIELCGDDVNAKAQQLIETCKNIVVTANNIINVNVNACGATPPSTTTFDAENEDVMEPAVQKTKISCFFKLLGKTLKLKNQIRRAIRLIRQIPKVPGTANECVNTAAQNLGNVFNQFPSKANIIQSSPLDNLDYKFVGNDIAEGIVETEPYLISWSTLNIVIRKALSIILGVKCTVREVLEIKAAALKFIDDIERCGNNVSESVQPLLDACKNIIVICNDILHVNENICGNSLNPEETDNSTTPKKCFKKLYKRTVELKDQVKEAITLIKNITNTGKCVTEAVRELESVFIKFPIKIEFCSKLIH